MNSYHNQLQWNCYHFGLIEDYNLMIKEIYHRIDNHNSIRHCLKRNEISSLLAFNNKNTFKLHSSNFKSSKLISSLIIFFVFLSN